MNKVILMGRLTRDPDVRYSQGESSMAIARYTEDSTVVKRTIQILSTLLHSVKPVNLLRNIYTRELRYW